ncbi:hypothetical protein ABJI51_02650 [Amycolatopsis sp. NEAU-NG30]|uniref:Uncharacterized protein n=1 Tax=Amycolatopsis melonis TaxID=3156488 RepID=A0ABV0L6M6_9PSEU
MEHVRRKPAARQRETESGPGSAAAEPALLRLQRLAGNAATTRLVTVQRDLDDQAALAAVDGLPPHVLSGNGGVPLATQAAKQEFLRAGREWFGSHEATLAHFQGIEQSTAPGHPFLHRTAKARLEAAIASLGGPGPSSTVAFSFRKAFTPDTHYTPASMHTLGYAIDYDATNMPRIGRGETAELLRLTGGGPSNAELGEYSARRAVISATGNATAAGEAPPAEAAALMDRIRAESQRLAASSQAFQASLGAARDQFLELRTRYFEAATPEEKAAVLAQVPALIGPWTTAITTEENRLTALAAAAGLDPAALPAKAQLTARIARIEAAAREAGRAVAQARGREPDARSRLWTRLTAWESLVQTSPEGTFGERVTRVTERAQTLLGGLRPLVGAKETLAKLTSLRAKLSDPAFLFGRAKRKKGERPTTATVADTPSMAQLLERGYFNPRDPAAGREHFNAEFLVALAQHGFDLGVAWGGESTDSMHMELVVPRGG